MSVKDISNLEQSIAMRITAVSIIGVLLFVTLVILLSRSITQPLGRLLLVIQGMQKNMGRFVWRVDIRSRDEVGQLAIAFNGMLEDLETSQGQLQRYTKELEVQVVERTRGQQKEKKSLRASKDYPGAPSLLAKVIGVYLATSPTLVQRLCEAVAQGNSTARREAAHSLKSSSANLGAVQLAGLCKELEQIGRAGQLQGAAEILSTLQQHYLRVRAALNAQLSDQSPGFPSELQPALLSQGT